MGLFDGCRCRRLDLHGSKQRVYVVRASSETSAWRSCSWPRIAKLRAILHWPPLAFLIKKPEIRNGYTSHVTGLVRTARIPFSGWPGLPCEARFWDWKLGPARTHYL